MTGRSDVGEPTVGRVEVEDLDVIVARYRAAGHRSPARAAVAEWQRQGREHRRVVETGILRAAARPGAEADRHLQELAAQVRDHRAAGNYITGWRAAVDGGGCAEPTAT